jgi:type VI secretion system protein VasG
MTMNLKALTSKLNRVSRTAMEQAVALTVSRTHYDVEIEHYLRKLLDNTDDDSARILHQFGIDPSRLAEQLDHALDRLKTGNPRTPALSPTLVEMLSRAWEIASLEYGATKIRSGHTMLALCTTPALWRQARESSRELGRINPDLLKQQFIELLKVTSEEEGGAAVTEEAAETGEGSMDRPKGSGKTPNLDQFTVNLTDQAKAGKIDPVLGRDQEIRQIVDILMRRRQNNPILTGEAGVGKTAVVEGFATRVVQGDVPEPLKNVTVRTLDLALLQAGAGVKGEFENRLKGLIEEVKSSPTPIILFIDEAHTMIGAGGSAGQGDAANLLKPALARGEMRTIAATTWSEYKKYFEKDPALARRFQVVKVDEPSEKVCQVMMRGIVGSLEKHHKVRILDEAVNAAVRLSHRYLAGRQLPDKAVSILDTSCARVALGQAATPPALEDAQRQLDDLIVQARVLDREQAAGADHSERLADIATRKTMTEEQLAALKARWEVEKKLVEEVRALRIELEAGTGTPEMKADLQKKLKEMAELQGETPLMRPTVDEQTVSEVIAAWTGIPVGKMLKDEIEATLRLGSLMGQRVIGQDHALDVVAQRLQTAKAGLDDPSRPIGVFMLVGPSGVGKTETALALADIFYGGEKSLVTINMSEFQEAHTVSTLKGSPPGYVGYGEGGVLTEAVRRRPYSVVLLDEVEKAHPDVLELFYQVFDKGMMEDGEGREIDFKNTIILLTSNAATDTLMKLVADPETAPSPAGLVKALKPELDKIFKPAFLGRLSIIPFYPIRDEAMKKIIVLKLGKIVRRLLESHRITLSYDQAVVDEIAKRCTEVESGARNVDNILSNTMLPEISRRLLTEIAEGRKPATFHVALDSSGAFAYTAN